MFFGMVHIIFFSRNSLLISNFIGKVIDLATVIILDIEVFTK